MFTDILGYLAAGLVFATFCSQRTVTLRPIAIASNLAFIGYAYLACLWPILILHGAMLPINVVRCRQSVRVSGGATVDGARPSPTTSSFQPEASSLRDIAISVFGRLRCWKQRQQFRRELRTMSARDFSVLRVPPSLVTGELRRWPWQKPNPQWRTTAFGQWGEDRHDLEDSGQAN